MNNEEKIIQKLIDHDELLRNMVTKGEFNDFKNSILSGQDQILTILKS